MVWHIAGAALFVIALVSIFIFYPAITVNDFHPQCTASLTNGPTLQLPFGSHLASGTWVVVNEFVRDIWDIRDSGGLLNFMTVKDNETGVLSQDATLLARTFAVRLVCEMAYTVHAIGKQGDVVAGVTGMVNDIMGKIPLPSGVKSQLEKFKQQVSQGSSFTQPVVAVITASRGAADDMMQKRSDIQAEVLLEAILSSSLSQLTRDSLIMFLILRSWEYLQSDNSSWVGQLYANVTQGTQPLLDALSITYGNFEATHTLQSLIVDTPANQLQLNR